MSNGSTSGRDATRPRGRSHPGRPDDYGRNGSARNTDLYAYANGAKTGHGAGEGASRTTGRRPDEIDRSTVTTKASVRFDHYRGDGPSEASGGPTRPRNGAVRYEDIRYGK